MILLHLLPTLNYSAARQVSLLSAGLRSLTLPARADVHVAALGPEGPLAELLRSAGVPLHVLGSGRRFDLASLWSLRRLLRDLRPDVVLAWRLPALRAAGLLRSARQTTPFQLFVTEPQRCGRMNRLDRWLLRSADAVLAGYPAETDAVRLLGVAPERIQQIPAVVVPPASPLPLGLSLPADAKIVMCVGSLRPAHGFRDAIWAADVLRYPLPNLHLVIIGDGPELDRLKRFARGINPAGGHVHFLPARPDAANLLAHADVVWVPSRTECGRQVVLEALAAGRPVVASALSGLAALVDDARTGLLVPPGNPLELARRSRPLFEDAALARRLGAAGREAVGALSPERAASAFVRLLGNWHAA